MQTPILTTQTYENVDEMTKTKNIIRQALNERLDIPQPDKFILIEKLMLIEDEKELLQKARDLVYKSKDANKTVQ